jgi:DNA replication and repair protein RecF
LLAEYTASRSKELLVGITLVGPQRDEIKIKLGEGEAKRFASMGQKRSILAALRYAEWLILEEQLKIAPLFSIDDFAAHLDEKRAALDVKNARKRTNLLN